MQCCYCSRGTKCHRGCHGTKCHKHRWVPRVCMARGYRRTKGWWLGCRRNKCCGRSKGYRVCRRTKGWWRTKGCQGCRRNTGFWSTKACLGWRRIKSCWRAKGHRGWWRNKGCHRIKGYLANWGVHQCGSRPENIVYVLKHASTVKIKFCPRNDMVMSITHNVQ